MAFCEKGFTLVRLSISLCLFAILVLSAHKSYSRGTEVIDHSLESYIDFILEWTSYSYKGETPPLVKSTHHELVQIFAYGDFEYAQAESKDVKLPQVNAVYDQKRKTIYISDRLDPQSNDFKLALIHELVHYLQDINGYTASLNGFLICTESEAYDIQMLYQRIYEINVDSIPLVHQQGLLAATRCMGNKSSAFPKYEH